MARVNEPTLDVRSTQYLYSICGAGALAPFLGLSAVDKCDMGMHRIIITCQQHHCVRRGQYSEGEKEDKSERQKLTVKP